MINEERVIEMTQLSIYDDKANRQTDQFEEYYGRDYVGKEVLKSIFTGTFAYLGILALFVLGTVESFEDTFRSMDLEGTVVRAILFYIIFEVLYLIVTVVVYRQKFQVGRRDVKEYAKHLKRINKMYARDEKNRG